MILVLMGVTGSGKSTVGKMLAAVTGWQFVEGDDFHSEANRNKMHEGIPLTDEDRDLWLARLHQVLLDWNRKGINGILACSALKQKYRDVLSFEIPPLDMRFVWLDMPRSDLEERLRNRKNHYMNPNLLQSQLDTLEIPVGANAIHVAAEADSPEIVQKILNSVCRNNEMTPAPGAKGIEGRP